MAGKKGKYQLGDRGAVDLTGQEGGEAPRGPDGKFLPHFAIRTGDTEVIAFYPGMIFYMVEDPRFSDSIFPFVLEKVSLKQLVFRCYSLDGKSSKRLIYNASQKGQFVASFHDKHQAQAKRISELQEAAADDSAPEEG